MIADAFGSDFMSRQPENRCTPNATRSAEAPGNFTGATPPSPDTPGNPGKLDNPSNPENLDSTTAQTTPREPAAPSTPTNPPNQKNPSTPRSAETPENPSRESDPRPPKNAPGAGATPATIPPNLESPDGDKDMGCGDSSVPPEIVVRGLHFAYAGARGGDVFETAAERRARRAGLAPQASPDIPALVDINLECAPGTLTLLCGASGCGKSTLLRALNGLVPFFHRGTLRGSVTVGGLQVPDAPLSLLGDTSATVFQNPRTQFFTADVASELAFRAENAGEPPAQIWRDIHRACGQLDTTKFLGRSLGALSGGELQKIACTSALASGRRILLFDEPTSNLSPQAIAEFAGILEQLKAGGYTLVVAEHRLYFLAGLADRVLVLDHGRVIRDYSGGEFFALDDSIRLDLGLRALTEPTLETATTRLRTVEPQLRPESRLAPHEKEPAKPANPTATQINSDPSSILESSTIARDSLRPESRLASHEPEASRATPNATTAENPTNSENPDAASEHKFAAQGAAAKTTHQGRFFTPSPVTAPLYGLRRAAQPAKSPTASPKKPASPAETATHEPADLSLLYSLATPTAKSADTPPTGGLRLENLRFAYGKRQILDIPDFTFPAGQVSVLVGQNGVGKTTLSRVICGLARAEGRISLGGRALSRRERQREAYIVMQDVHRQLFADTVLAEVTLGQKPYRAARATKVRKTGKNTPVTASFSPEVPPSSPTPPSDTTPTPNSNPRPSSSNANIPTPSPRLVPSPEVPPTSPLNAESRMAPPPERVQKILTDLDLWKLRERHPLSLSGGQKQRLVIASALAWRKRVYIFDEPTSGVDYRHLVQIAAQLRALAATGAVVIVVTHDFELVEHAADAVIRLAPHEHG